MMGFFNKLFGTTGHEDRKMKIKSLALAVIFMASASATADVSQRDARKQCVKTYGQQSVRVTVQPHFFKIYMKKSGTYCTVNRNNHKRR